MCAEMMRVVMTDLNAAQFSLATTRTRQPAGVRSWFGWLRPLWQQLCRILLVQPSISSFLEPLLRLWQADYRAGWYRVQWLSGQRHGQFLLLRLKPSRRWTGFLPGQHLTLMVEINGRAVSRTFSISSARCNNFSKRAVLLYVYRSSLVAN